MLFGGNADNGAEAGPFYVNSNNAWSNANSNIGARHTHTDNKLAFIVFPTNYGAANSLSLDPGGRSYRRVKTYQRKGPEGQAGLM